MEKIDKYKICFVGGLYDDEKLELKLSKNDFQNAANITQWKIIQGIEENLGKNIDIISSKFIGYFPCFYKKLLIKGKRNNRNNAIYEQLGFINFWGFRNIIKTIKVYKRLYKWCSINKDKNKVIIIYSMHSPFVDALYKLKRRFKNINTHIIIPDLPEYMRLGSKSHIVYNFFKKHDIKNLKKKIYFFNSYTVLTKHMIDKLNIPYEKTVVIEAIANSKTINKENLVVEKKAKTFLYSGTLNWKFGIKDLVESFIALKDKNATLEICGSGEAKDYIITMSETYPNIKYLGVLTNDEVIKLQKSATILVNPRNDESEYTKYSFPSKIIEYLSSGTPTIGYKLKGIPSEYFKYMYIVDNDNGGLYSIMKETINKKAKELNDRGQEAKKFIDENKNKEIQSKKIIDIIEKNLQE